MRKYIRLTKAMRFNTLVRYIDSSKIVEIEEHDKGSIVSCEFGEDYLRNVYTETPDQVYALIKQADYVKGSNEYNALTGGKSPFIHKHLGGQPLPSPR